MSDSNLVDDCICELNRTKGVFDDGCHRFVCLSNHSSFGFAVLSCQQRDKRFNFLLFQLLESCQQFNWFDGFHEHEHIFVFQHVENYICQHLVVLDLYNRIVWDSLLKLRVKLLHRSFLRVYLRCVLDFWEVLWDQTQQINNFMMLLYLFMLLSDDFSLQFSLFSWLFCFWLSFLLRLIKKWQIGTRYLLNFS